MRVSESQTAGSHGPGAYLAGSMGTGPCTKPSPTAAVWPAATGMYKARARVTQGRPPGRHILLTWTQARRSQGEGPAALQLKLLKGTVTVSAACTGSWNTETLVPTSL